MSRRARAGNASEDESQPLLFPRVETASDCHENPPSTQQDKRCSWPWIYFVGVVLAIAVVSDVGETLWVAPRMRLFESVICSDYYRAVDPSLVDGDGSVPEKLCKVDAVQEKLASILGLQFFFDSVPAIILPIPYGYLADKSGRKWILIFSLWGYAASYAWTLLSVSNEEPLAFLDGFANVLSRSESFTCHCSSYGSLRCSILSVGVQLQLRLC